MMLTFLERLAAWLVFGALLVVVLPICVVLGVLEGVGYWLRLVGLFIRPKAEA